MMDFVGLPLVSKTIEYEVIGPSVSFIIPLTQVISAHKSIRQ